MQPATSVDPERLFSFSGGTISKLRNQLSDESARATVLVGQWGGVPGLLPIDEMEKQLKAGWTRKKDKSVEGPEVIVVDD